MHVPDNDAIRATTRLLAAANRLHASLDVVTTRRAICEEALQLLDGDAAALYRCGNRLALEDAIGEPPRDLCARVAETGAPALAPDAHSLAVPLRCDGAFSAVLGVHCRRALTQHDLALAEALAEAAAVARRNAEASAALALAASTDSLTGCLNHAALQDGLRREIERCARTGQDLSLVLLDLDDFKRVNELHGHLVGDEVLRRAAHALRMSTRPYDLVARYGGDEFALVCVDTDERAALEIAARAVARLGAAIEDLGPAQATAGVAQWNASQTPTQLLEQADRALLFGKQEGPRGGAQPASELPEHFRPGRFRRPDRARDVPAPAGGLDSRLDAMTSAAEAIAAAAVDEDRRVVEWAEAVGRRLGMGDGELRDLRYGAVLHDVGKAAVPEAILAKQGPLDDAERAIVQRHALAGERILARVDLLERVRPLVRHEHERWDGGGYPDGLRGEEIPLGARIVFVCDAFGAMTSERPYRAPMSVEAARGELRAAAGTQFDPGVVDAFLAILDEPA